MAERLRRRRFEPLADAPKIQGRIFEIERLAVRALGRGDERLSYQANDWLMRTMKRECRRRSVTAVHSYEDCSSWQFEEAKRLGKACIYDMPIAYYEAWKDKEKELAKVFADWLPVGGLPSKRFARPEQKKREMELADLVLVPSSFVHKTINKFVDKQCALASYGVDTEFWRPRSNLKSESPIRFIYVGQINIRKGIPILLEAWKRAELPHAELLLVGPWLISDRKREFLNENIKYVGPCSPVELRNLYQSSDVFVFPSFFEGFGLVLLEAMACGLPILSSDASAAPDFLTDAAGVILPSGKTDAWREALRDLSARRDRLPAMGGAARRIAVRQTWQRYRQAVSKAVEPFV